MNIETLFQQLISNLSGFNPMAPLFDPGSRLFALNLIILTICILGWATLAYGWTRAVSLFTRKRYWWNRSTKSDYQIYAINIFIRALLIVPFFESSYYVSRETSYLLMDLFPDFRSLSPGFVAIALFTLFAFILNDLLAFLHHWAMHRIPVLWQFHKLHHSARVLTPVTLFRIHPVESLMVTLRTSATLGFITGLFVFLFSTPLTLITFFGINALGFGFNFLASNLRHSHLPLSFGVLEHWIISPRQHQIHHSRSSEHFDKNFGVTFAVWDWFFGSLVLSKSAKVTSFGLSESYKSRLSYLYLEPFWAIFRKIKLGSVFCKTSYLLTKEKQI